MPSPLQSWLANHQNVGTIMTHRVRNPNAGPDQSSKITMQKLWLGLKLYCILIFTIYCPLPPCHGAIHRKGLGQGRTHSSVLTQQNQAQNVFIIIHTPQTQTITRLFVTIIGHKEAGMQDCQAPLVIIYQ